MPSSRLQVLEADNNSIENLEGLYHLPKLEEVSLKNNSILSNPRFRFWSLFVGERPVLDLCRSCSTRLIRTTSYYTSMFPSQWTSDSRNVWISSECARLIAAKHPRWTASSWQRKERGAEHTHDTQGWCLLSLETCCTNQLNAEIIIFWPETLSMKKNQRCNLTKQTASIKTGRDT